MRRIAVILYNLGGPDKLEAVQPFLFNLFNDPLILRQAAPIRWVLAKIISSRRTPVAKEIYSKIGGGSPILTETEKQAKALSLVLGQEGSYRVFIAMRYWHPFAEECLKEVIDYNPEQVILVPLYPQFSTTTTESFLRVWRGVVEKKGFDVSTTSICCYPRQEEFIKTISGLLQTSLQNAGGPPNKLKILFSAHGLPKKFVVDGDPYESHVNATVNAILQDLDMPDLDHTVCYQSRVGPIEWLRPYTDEVVIKAARKGQTIIVVPVAFVSEHSETLVELDIEYRDLAMKHGAAGYVRTPTVGANTLFIAGIAQMVREAVQARGAFCSGGLMCDIGCPACPINQAIT